MFSKFNIKKQNNFCDIINCLYPNKVYQYYAELRAMRLILCTQLPVVCAQKVSYIFLSKTFGASFQQKIMTRSLPSFVTVTLARL